MPGERKADSRPLLSTRDREIVALRAQGLTLREIAHRFALSHARIAQILDRAATHPIADLVAPRPLSESSPATGRSLKADDRSRSSSLTPQSGQGPAVLAERRTHVRQLLAEGLPPSQIAARLDQRLTTIYADLAWIRAADAQPAPQ